MRVLLQVVGLLVLDLLSTLTFFVALGLFKSLYLATLLAIGVGLAQVAVMRLLGLSVAPMQWLSLALVVVLGSATLLTQNLVFIKFKPSIIYFALGAGMLRPGWMVRYVPAEILGEIERSVLVGWGYAWATLMILIALTNLALALRTSTEAWAWFASVGANLAQISFGAAQYLVIRNQVKTLRAARRLSDG